MKRITFLGVLLLCFTFTVNAQTGLSEAESEQLKANNRGIESTSVDLNALLARYAEIGSQSQSYEEYFTPQERLALRTHFNQTNPFSEGGCSTVSDCNLNDATPDDATSSFIWDRPFAGGTCCSGLGPVSYDVYGPFSVDTNGAYDVLSVQVGGWDGYLFVYMDCFDPLDQLNGFVAGDDDGAGGIGTSDIIGVALSTGVDYYVVTTGFAAGDFGDYETTITGPGAITCPSGGGGGGAVTAYGTEMVNANFSSFDTASPDDLTAIAPLASTSFENAGALNPAGDTAYVLASDGDFWSVDTATGVYTSLGTILPSTGGTWAGMEYDATSGTYYALSGNFNVDNNLHTVDPVGMTATALPNPVGMPGGGIGLAVDGAGDMWGYDLIDDNLYSIDKATGIGTIVGNIGFDANFGQGMSYDPNSDTIFMTAFNGAAFQAEWRSVDTATGNTTFIDVLGATNPTGLVQLAWFSTVNNSPPDNDTCAGATPIACGETLSGDTSDGNTDTNGAQYPNLTSPDEWYAFTSTVVGEIVTVSTCNQAAYDTRLSVYDDCTL